MNFQRLLFLHKSEGVPKCFSINSFCISNNILYMAFYNWFKKIQKDFTFRSGMNSKRVDPDKQCN